MNPITIVSALVQKLPPNIRLALYLLGFAVAVFAPWLTSHGWITTVDSETLLRIAGILTGGLAGVVLTGQTRNAGSTADQAIAAAKATAEKAASSATAAATAAADLERVKTAITGVAADVPIVGPVLGPLAQQAIDAL